PRDVEHGARRAAHDRLRAALHRRRGVVVPPQGRLELAAASNLRQQTAYTTVERRRFEVELAEFGEFLVVGEAAGVEVAELVAAGEHRRGIEGEAARVPGVEDRLDLVP